jgi:hypothetical protein
MDDPKRIRWFHLTPGRFVLLLLLVEALLWLSERLGWLAWHKGYAVLTGVAVVGVVLVLMGLGWALALIYKRRFQFRIRPVLAMSLAVALPFSWLCVEVRRAKAQRENSVQTEKLKLGDCASWRLDKDGQPLLSNFVQIKRGCYYWQLNKGGQPLANAQPPEPAWLRKTLGEDFFADFVWVDVPMSRAAMSSGQ